jgi:hypothetical protein
MEYFDALSRSHAADAPHANDHLDLFLGIEFHGSTSTKLNYLIEKVS